MLAPTGSPAKRGNDRLFGAGGNDVLVGGPGSDFLVGGVGADTLQCGPGRDIAIRDVGDRVGRDCEVVRGPKPVQRRAILRGQFEAGANAWGIMPLAVERLVGEGRIAKVLPYFEAVGRGESWEAAFAKVFGKSVEAFYAEFEAYRRGLERGQGA